MNAHYAHDFWAIIGIGAILWSVCALFWLWLTRRNK